MALQRLLGSTDIVKGVVGIRMLRIGVFIVGLGMLGACGGSSLDDVIDSAEDFGTSSPTEDDSEVFDTGAGAAGAVTVTAEPSMGWIEAGGERIDFDAVDMNGYECLITDEQVNIIYQVINGPTLTIRGGNIDGEWSLNLNADSVADDDVLYISTLPGDGSLGLADNQLSYEGPIGRVVDRDILNPEMVDGKIAINCSTPGEQPTAVLGGTEYVLSMVGASSVRCEISDERIDIDINRLTIDDTNLQVTVQAKDGGWSGIVAIGTPDGTFLPTETPDLSGFTVDGSTVTYEGTFEADAGEVEGTLEVTCP